VGGENASINNKEREKKMVPPHDPGTKMVVTQHKGFLFKKEVPTILQTKRETVMLQEGRENHPESNDEAFTSRGNGRKKRDCEERGRWLKGGTYLGGSHPRESACFTSYRHNNRINSGEE